MRSGKSIEWATALTYEEFNKFCGSLPATSYVMQWGGAHVWKVAGKVFAIGGWSQDDEPGFTFKPTEADYYILQDEPDYRPAPYMASRGLKWLQQVSSSTAGDEELKRNLRSSHRIVASGLSKKKRKELGLDEL